MVVRFISPIPSGLTPKQKEVFLLMDREKYLLYTNEGTNFVCWLQKGDGNKIPVNRRTATALADKKIIIPDDSFDHESSAVTKYRWKLK